MIFSVANLAKASQTGLSTLHKVAQRISEKGVNHF